MFFEHRDNVQRRISNLLYINYRPYVLAATLIYQQNIYNTELYPADA